MKFKNIKIMRKTILTAAFCLIAAMVISCGGGKGNGNIIKGDSAKFDSLSYAVGLSVASGIKGDMGGMKLNFDELKEGARISALGGESFKYGKSVITRVVADSILGDFFRNQYGRRVQALRAYERAKADTTGTVKLIEPEFNVETMFTTEEERSLISKTFGFDMGYRLGENPFVIHLLWFFNGLDEFDTESARMTFDEANAYIMNYMTVRIPAENKAASEEWLSKIEKKSGVIKTESGLLYKIIDAGDVNLKPTADDVVKVHYKGETRKGVVFDASRFEDMPKERQEMMKKYGRGPEADEPIEFPLKGVIKGWTEGLQFVGKGGKIELWIPSDLAYGSRGAGQNIGPNEALYFVVDLIDVPSKTKAAEETEKAAE